MRIFTRAFAVVIAAAALSAVSFAGSDESRFTVPFAFEVQGQTMPAGHYRLVMNRAHAPILTNMDAKQSVFLSPSATPHVINKGTTVQLIFSAYGNQRFLREYYEGANSRVIRVLPVSRQEQAVRAAAQRSTTTVEAGR